MVDEPTFNFEEVSPTMSLQRPSETVLRATLVNLRSLRRKSVFWNLLPERLEPAQEIAP